MKPKPTGVLESVGGSQYEMYGDVRCSFCVFEAIGKYPATAWTCPRHVREIRRWVARVHRMLGVA